MALDHERRAEERQAAECGDQGEVIDQVPPGRGEQQGTSARELLDSEGAIPVEDVADEDVRAARAADPRHQLLEVDDGRDAQADKPARDGREPVPGAPPARDPCPGRDEDGRREGEADDPDGVEHAAGGVRRRRLEADRSLTRQAGRPEVDRPADDADHSEADDVREASALVVPSSGGNEDRERRRERVFADAEGVAADHQGCREPAPSMAFGRPLQGHGPDREA